MLKVVIPDTKEKIIQQIKALEYQLEKDTTDKEREIHHEALHELRKALFKMRE